MMKLYDRYQQSKGALPFVQFTFRLKADFPIGKPAFLRTTKRSVNYVYTECLNLAKSIDAIMLCYNPDIDALKAENLSDMAVRLLDGVSRRDVVKDLEDFRDKWRHYNEQAAAESQVILDKISELLEKDGDSK